MSDPEAKAPAIHSWSLTPSSVVKFCHVWTIENFSFYQHDKVVVSPIFAAGANDETRWCLELHPNGEDQGIQDYMSLFLKLISCKTAGVPAKYEISILDANRVVLFTMQNNSPQRFKPGDGYGFEKFIPRHTVLDSYDYRPGDKLTVSCKVIALREPSNTPGRVSGSHFPLPLQPDERSSSSVAAPGRTFCGRPAIPTSLPRSTTATVRPQSPVRERMFRQEAPENTENFRSENRQSSASREGKDRINETARVIAALKQQKDAQQAELRRLIDISNLPPALRSRDLVESHGEDSSSGTSSIAPRMISEDLREAHEEYLASIARLKRRSSTGVKKTAISRTSSNYSRGQSSYAYDPREERNRSDRTQSVPSNLKKGAREDPRELFSPDELSAMAEKLLLGTSGPRPESLENRAVAGQNHPENLTRPQFSDSNESVLDAACAAYTAAIGGCAPRCPFPGSTGTSSTATLSDSQSSKISESHQDDQLPRQAVAEKGDSADIPLRNLTAFNGDLAFFRLWWLDFRLKVHDRRDLNPAQKFTCLRSALLGEATKAIRGTSSPESDYIHTLRNLFLMYGGDGSLSNSK